MRDLSTRWWALVAAAALLGYLGIVIVAIAVVWNSGSEDFHDLTRSVALFAGLFFAGPSIALSILLLTRWRPRVIAVVAIGWLAINAVLWLPIMPIVSVWATVSAGVIIVALLWERQSQTAGFRH